MLPVLPKKCLQETFLQNQPGHWRAWTLHCCNHGENALSGEQIINENYFLYYLQVENEINIISQLKDANIIQVLPLRNWVSLRHTSPTKSALLIFSLNVTSTIDCSVMRCSKMKILAKSTWSWSTLPWVRVWWVNSTPWPLLFFNPFTILKLKWPFDRLSPLLLCLVTF